VVENRVDGQGGPAGDEAREKVKEEASVLALLGRLKVRLQGGPDSGPPGDVSVVYAPHSGSATLTFDCAGLAAQCVAEVRAALQGAHDNPLRWLRVEVWSVDGYEDPEAHFHVKLSRPVLTALLAAERGGDDAA
jgi:hypothetical protein